LTLIAGQARAVRKIATLAISGNSEGPRPVWRSARLRGGGGEWECAWWKSGGRQAFAPLDQLCSEACVCVRAMVVSGFGFRV
jgi:hypothetical protein